MKDRNPAETEGPSEDAGGEAEDADLSARLTAARPEADVVGRAVVRARVAAAMFGSAEAVRVGRYELLSEIGSGGGGTVYVARDPELHREVALKLVRAEDEALRVRAFAEAQALARLSHPNVVPVFDVGMLDDRVWLVMELVRGESLRAFAAKAPALREVVRAYRQAGEGLCAAHDAGLLHRDFKPDNAVIGGDGRVRVIDFGLAEALLDDQAEGVEHGSASPAPPEVARAAPSDADVPATPPGSGSPSPGTPRYMAPEQLRGGAATAASDQFAFAVALREAATRSGTVALPRWLEGIVRRGVAVDPAERYPSMRALLRALADDPASRWRRRALVAGPVVFALVGFAAGRGGDAAPVACDGAAALAPAWTRERSAALRAHLGELATPFARLEAERVQPVVDGWAERWIAAHEQGCAAQRRQELSATLEDRRLACMAAARTRFDSALDLVVRADAAALPAASRALSELPEPERCADATALVDDVAPASAAQAGDVAAVSAELERVTARVDASAADAVAAADQVVARARQLQYRPLLGRALLTLGRAEMAGSRRERAIALLTEASALALSAGDDATAVEAFARAMWVKSIAAGDPGKAMAGLEVVAALAERLGPAHRFARALLHNNAGTVELAAGRPDRARAELEKALALAKEVHGPGEVELAVVRGNLAMVARDDAERAALLAEGVAIRRDRLGDDHPLTLQTRIGAAFTLPDPAQALAALRVPCARLGEVHPTLAGRFAECASELAWLELAYGTRAAARTLFAAVAAVADTEADPQRIALARGYLALLDGEVVAARRILDGLPSAPPLGADAQWWQRLGAAEIDIARTSAALAAGDAAAARAALARATDNLESARRVQAAPVVLRRLRWVQTAGRAALATD
jgi:eukaryotic-like serine/threonine-protein kinase